MPDHKQLELLSWNGQLDHPTSIPLKTFWDILFKPDNDPQHTVQDVTQLLVEEWQEIPQNTIRRVISRAFLVAVGSVLKLEEVAPLTDNSGSSSEAVLSIFGEWSRQ